MNLANILKKTSVAFAAVAFFGACASTPSEGPLLAPTVETRLVDGGASHTGNTGNDYLVLAERSWDSEERALEHYAKALEVNGQNALAYFKRGEIFKGRGEYDRAIDEFEMAIEADPGFAYAFIFLAHLSMDEESLESAETYVNRAVAINPEISEARMLRASIRLHMDQQDEALEDLHYVTEFGSKSERASAFMELGSINFYNGDVEAALVEYQAAIDANPDDTWGYVAAAEALAKSGQLEEAIEVLEVGVSASWDPSWASTEVARVLVEMGRYEEALGRVTQVLGVDPGRIDSLGIRGHAQLGLGRYDDAIADFELFLEQNEWDSWTRSEFARALLRVGRVDEAEGQFATAIDHWWDNIYARAGLSEVAEKRGRFVAAADGIREALEMAPENAFLLLRAATLLERSGSSEEAAEMLTRIERIDDDEIHRFKEYTQHNPDAQESAERVVDRLSREQQGRFQ